MRLVIIGGVAAGATAAARARRLDETAEITVIEKGPYVSFANCGLPYRLSGDITKRSALILQTAEGFFSRYRVNVALKTEAIAIDRIARTVLVRSPEGERNISYDKLILAQGGTPFIPPVEGVDSPNVFRLWTIPDMDAINAYIADKDAKSAVVVGGGFIGLETAEAFIKRGLSTSIVELTDQLMPPADPEFGALIAGAFTKAGAAVYTQKSLARIDFANRSVELSDGTILPADIVLMSAGVRPNLGLAKSAGLEIGTSGGLLVDEFLKTSDPDILAAGDMVELLRRVDGAKVRIPLAGPANRQGRIAATNALGGAMKYPGALGSSVFKAVDYTFAQTGLSEKAAAAAGIKARAVHVHRAHHASYYPGSKDLSLKLIYTEEGSLLGAEAFGEEGVEKRIDVLATALAARMKLSDLADLDLTYAPPYSSANDPLQMAAFAAQNDLSGYSRFIAPREAAALAAQKPASVQFLDVRTFGEYLKGYIAGSLHMPLDEIRDRLEEIPRGKRLVIISIAGFEGHLASRILQQQGFQDVAYVTGGMTSMRLFGGFEELQGE
ncbi:MAG: CoA-disulfide reductase [Spirochaetae bacterium HGW-Spirochaetae-9]|nr:MAG: CoA-disulfide reductase [Spirochaetae bacterium HGW-Spirochaetae-9]